jgi:hypothetical protein
MQSAAVQDTAGLTRKTSSRSIIELDDNDIKELIQSSEHPLLKVKQQ